MKGRTLGAITPHWMQGSDFGLIGAIGAEIPDTIQSVTMARGYGSIAVSNTIGSEILTFDWTRLPWL